MMSALFESPVQFSVPRELEESALVDDLHEMLRLADEMGRADEAISLLQSYLSWLRHHLAQER
jgi:hypothetical protein